VDEVIQRDYDLTARNPNIREEYEYESPENLLCRMIEKEKQISKILDELRQMFFSDKHEI